MAYLPIADYGVIGDMRSVALVSKRGSIDWCCLPAFDSPSVFGGILDDQRGGSWSIAPRADCDCRQMYLPDTNVLITRFFADEGMAEVTDFMTVGREPRRIVRILKAIRGPLEFRMECRPAFDYARQEHELELDGEGRAVVFRAPACQFVLQADRALERRKGAAVAEFTLQGGEEAVFTLCYRDCGDSASMMAERAEAQDLLRETVRYWRGWARQSQYEGRWREIVTRSALVLKLLTYEPTGAIVAAPTTSLPEQVGGVRNWDYRYTWVRDAAFTVYSLIRLGYTEEAGAFARFMQARAQEEGPRNGPLDVMYGIDGRHELEEIELGHLSGYRGSRPVRIGNAAYGHFQTDIYGELMDSLYLYDKYGRALSYEMWTTVERLLDWVVEHWRDDDRSIWEVRGPVRPFTFSKLQCWVALDRGVRLARKRSFPSGGIRWYEERDRIYKAIMNEGWNEGARAFTQYFGSDAVDASALMMPLMLFVASDDPRMLGTLARIRQDLSTDGLVLRYKIGEASHDGLPGQEGYFSVCSFWLVEAMARAGQVEEAQLLFEKLLGYANHLGLYSEEIGLKGELLGNFPQALTHLGLISAAFNLNRLLPG